MAFPTDWLDAFVGATRRILGGTPPSALAEPVVAAPAGIPWDPAALDRVRALHLHARQAVEGSRAGGHRSARPGHDVEFLDYQPYTPGDALRHLDWRVYARTDRLVVRRHRAERELAATLVFDASADLGSTPAKWTTALRLTATLAWFLHLQGEPVGLVIGGGEGVPWRVLPPRASRAHLARVFAALATVRPAGRADLAALFREVGGRLGLRTLCAVVSDFMEEPAAWEREVAALVRHRVDLRAFEVYDPDELGLVGHRAERLWSPETGRELPVDPGPARALLAEESARFTAEVAAAVRRHRGAHRRVPADADLAEVVGWFARGRP